MSSQRQQGGTRIGATAAETGEIDAENWRCKQLAIVAENIQKADSDDERLEYVARQSWLLRWVHSPKKDAEDKRFTGLGCQGRRVFNFDAHVFRFPVPPVIGFGATELR